MGQTEMQKLNRRLPNFRHLRAFSEVARTGSISRAAERIHLSQPAITQALAKLEETVGLSLFERRSDGMRLADPGRVFLDRVDRALAQIRKGGKEALRLGQRKGGRGFANFDELLTTPQLRALVAVAGAGNFTLAARDAGVSQPTLHRAARDVERLSGLTLFEKTSRGIDLTPAAVAFSQAVKLAFSELDQGFMEINELLGMDMGRIVVGSLPLPRTFVLPTAIQALLEERPDVNVQVIDGPYDDLLQGLRQGDLDVLVGALRIPVPIDDVVQEALFSDPLAVVARAGHPLAGRKAIRLQDLVAYPWAVPRQGTPTREAFDQMFPKEDAPRNLVESSSLILIRGLLLKSDRLTLISAHQILPEREMGLLVPLDFDMRGTDRPIGLTQRRDWRPTATQRRFLECLRQAGHQARSQH